MKMKGLVVVSTLILVAASHVGESRWMGDGLTVESTVTCEATYGFLPCSTSIWGLLFLIVVYNILLSMAGQYVGEGSNLFFQIIGPGVVGGSVFQFLGSIPRLVVLLVPLLTGSKENAQERASAGMGMVLGGVAMLLTLIWGLTVIIGSDDQSESQDTTTHVQGSAVVTDIETSWTARLILVASVPFLILEFQNLFTSQSAKRVVILIALIVTILLLTAYIVYQSFRPWIQNRCFEHMMEKYEKDKLLKLISSNGKPDTRKIQQLFNTIARDNSASVTAAEIRVLALGIKMEDKDTTTDLYLDTITAYFDTTGDGVISRDEFINGMTNLASTLLDHTTPPNNNAQISSEEQQALLGSSTSRSRSSSSQRGSNSWSIYLRASLFLIFGTGMAYVLSEPLVSSVISLANAANLPSFFISYVVLPLSLNYNGILQAVTSALQKDQKSNSLTLSSLYGRVLMNNLMGLIPFLAPVYFRNLTSDASAELLLVLAICIIMGLFTSFNTIFPKWTGYVVLSLYPISLLTVYLLTTVLGWS